MPGLEADKFSFVRQGAVTTRPGELHPGDVVVIPAGVKHWHGAAPNCWFSHLAIEIPGEDTHSEWLEPVSDQTYHPLP